MCPCRKKYFFISGFSKKQSPDFEIPRLSFIEYWEDTTLGKALGIFWSHLYYKKYFFGQTVKQGPQSTVFQSNHAFWKIIHFFIVSIREARYLASSRADLLGSSIALW